MQELLIFLKIDLLVSIPQFFTYWLFCFSFLETRPPKLLKRLFITTIIHSVYTDALLLILPTHLHLINTMLTGLILMFVIFKDLRIKQKISLLIFAILFGIIMDLVLSTIAIYGMGIPLSENMLRDKLPLVLTILYPQLILTSIASWFIRNRQKTRASRIFAIVNDIEKTHLTLVTSLIVVQFILLGALQLIQISPDKHNFHLNVILVYLIIFVSLLALVSIIRLLVRTREQAARSTQEVYVDDIHDMFTSIRGQRHDFLNHVQVIHTMVQMGRTEQLKAYVGDLVKETRDVSDIVHHASPALAAFAQAKMAVSLGKGIAFSCELPDKWNDDQTVVKAIDIIKIMGNLVDNAFDETMSLPPEDRFVEASIRSSEDGAIELRVANRGREIEQELRQRIFAPGFTTKGDGHSGLGLAIVQERVKHYNGSLELHFDRGEEMTVFRASLPSFSA